MAICQDNDPSSRSLVLNLDQAMLVTAIRESLVILSDIQHQLPPHQQLALARVLTRLGWALLQLPISIPDRSSILALNRHQAHALAQSLAPDLSRIQAILRTLS